MSPILESLLLFAKGAGIGFVIAAPVGPVGILCVHRTLRHGRLAGLVAGLGAAVGDAVYGLIAAFGLTLISDWLLQHQEAVRLIGGMFLLGLAAKMLLARQSEPPPGEAQRVARAEEAGLIQAFWLTFALTMTNPITILAFLGIFAAAGTGDLTDHSTLAAALVLGVFVGSALWWMGLAAGAGLIRERLEGGGLIWVTRISALMILGFAVYLLRAAALDMM
jgi:threonine/homoserine/homoserine lactone efflux protein